jgi:hypothetical protein
LCINASIACLDAQTITNPDDYHEIRQDKLPADLQRNYVIAITHQTRMKVKYITEIELMIYPTANYY